MVVQIDEATGATPTWNTNTTAVVWNTADSVAGTSSEIATPTATGTNFSYVKSFAIDITTVNSLSMTNVKVGKVTTEATTGTKLWLCQTHTVAAYSQATAAPAATSDNNSTAPVIPAGGTNTNTIACPLIGSASVYSAGAFSSTGRQGLLIEFTLGVDATNTTAGTGVATPTLRWSWTEG